jgi:hypothetical protein
MKYYVYTYSNPETGFIFYVGKGQKDRAYQHLRRRILKLKLHNDRFAEEIDKILESNQEPIIKICKHFENENEACNFESEMIQSLGIENLTNKQIFSWPIQLTPEVLKKRAESCKNNIEWRKTMQSIEHREKLSKACKLGIEKKGGRKPLTPAHKEAVSKGLKGKFRGDKNPSCKNTSEQIYAYLEAIMQGANWKKLAQEMGIKNAWKIAQRKDWTHIEAPPGYQPLTRRCIDEESIQTTLKMIESGYSHQEISKVIGFTTTTVRNILKANQSL